MEGLSTINFRSERCFPPSAQFPLSPIENSKPIAVPLQFRERGLSPRLRRQLIMHPAFQPVDVVLIGLCVEGPNNICRPFPWVCSSMLGKVPKALPTVIGIVHFSLSSWTPIAQKFSVQNKTFQDAAIEK
jgi:hypothetical protein